MTKWLLHWVTVVLVVVVSVGAVLATRPTDAGASFRLTYEEGAHHDDGIMLPTMREVTYYQAPAPRPVRRVARAPVRSAPFGNDFWRRLANCESPDGRSGAFIGYFQFHPGTARQVGIDGSESYEVQRAAAQEWASRVNPGTTAGWPVCWHKAR